MDVHPYDFCRNQNLYEEGKLLMKPCGIKKNYAGSLDLRVTDFGLIHKCNSDSVL